MNTISNESCNGNHTTRMSGISAEKGGSDDHHDELQTKVESLSYTNQIYKQNKIMQHNKRTYLLPQFLPSCDRGRRGHGYRVFPTKCIQSTGKWKCKSGWFHYDQLRDHEELIGRQGKEGRGIQSKQMLFWRHLLRWLWNRWTAGPDSEPCLDTESLVRGIPSGFDECFQQILAIRVRSSLQFEQWGLACWSQHKQIGIDNAHDQHNWCNRLNGRGKRPLTILLTFWIDIGYE